MISGCVFLDSCVLKSLQTFSQKGPKVCLVVFVSLYVCVVDFSSGEPQEEEGVHGHAGEEVSRPSPCQTFINSSYTKIKYSLKKPLNHQSKEMFRRLNDATRKTFAIRGVLTCSAGV